MARGEIGKIFEVLAEDAIKAGRDTVEKMENFTRDTAKRVATNVEEATKADQKVADQLTKAGGKEPELPVRKDSRGRVIPDGVERLPSGRLPSNFEYAGRVYDGDKWTPKLAKKYPNGVRFTEDGFPDFAPYATHTVTFDPNFKGNHGSDFVDANKLAGLPATPDGYTWHHTQDGKTMQLIPRDLHRGVSHAGGVAIMKGRD
jgi:hypothetical protein